MIAFENVTMCYEDTGDTPLTDFNLTVNSGEMLVLYGESGVGKSTIIRLLIGDIKPTNGRIIVDNIDLNSLNKRTLANYRSKIGVVFQDYRLIPDKTVYENVELPLLLSGIRKKDHMRRISNVLSLMGLANLHKLYPHELSGGQCQKLCMARAIVTNPKYLFADEPTANLDPESTNEIMRLLRIIQLQGITVVLATHTPEEVVGDNNIRKIEII